MTSLPVGKCSGDDTDAILGASKIKRLSYSSFHLIHDFDDITNLFKLLYKKH